GYFCNTDISACEVMSCAETNDCTIDLGVGYSCNDSSRCAAKECVDEGDCECSLNSDCATAYEDESYACDTYGYCFQRDTCETTDDCFNQRGYGYVCGEAGYCDPFPCVDEGSCECSEDSECLDNYGEGYSCSQAVCAQQQQPE
ncbi:MAG: hypothetical protein Q7J80_01290, partial [Anaerolineales bacterium]|nr:hypothetical protein [Anaerolineales bacterium]